MTDRTPRKKSTASRSPFRSGRVCDFCRRDAPPGTPALSLWQCHSHGLGCPGGEGADRRGSLQVCFACCDALGLDRTAEGRSDRLVRCPVGEPLDVSERAASVLEWEARGWDRK